MQFKLTTSLVAVSVVAMLNGVTAAAVDSTGTESAQNAAVEFCTSNNLSGSCFVFSGLSNDACVNLPSDLNDDISSVHVQSGTTCVVWVDDNCSGNSLFIGSDVDALGDFNFNDVISSFECSSA